VRVVEVTTDLSDEQWRFKPDPDRWSIAEILEHMVIVHERVLGRVREQLPQAPAPPADRDYHKLDAIVLEKIPDRSIKGKAPDYILLLVRKVSYLLRNSALSLMETASSRSLDLTYQSMSPTGNAIMPAIFSLSLERTAFKNSA
jgi:hypothetical protein